jgi:putative flippase GtrA
MKHFITKIYRLVSLVLHKRFIKYIINGLIALAAELSSFFLLRFAFPEVSLVILNTTSFFIGLSVSYELQRRLFNSQFKNYKQMAKYITLVCVNVLLSNLLLILLNSLLGSVALGKLITPFLIAIWNYFVFKKFVFVTNSPTD